MSKQWNLFIRILIILVILVILLPQLVDDLIKLIIIEEDQYRPNGNSTFVLSPSVGQEKNFKQNLSSIIKCFMK